MITLPDSTRFKLSPLQQLRINGEPAARDALVRAGDFIEIITRTPVGEIVSSFTAQPLWQEPEEWERNFVD